MNYNKKINIFLSLKIASIFVSSLSITHLLEVTAVMATVILDKGTRNYKGYLATFSYLQAAAPSMTAKAAGRK